MQHAKFKWAFFLAGVTVVLLPSTLPLSYIYMRNFTYKGGRCNPNHENCNPNVPKCNPNKKISAMKTTKKNTIKRENGSKCERQDAFPLG